MLARAELTPVLNSGEQVDAWSAHARGENRSRRAALHIDTGLNRLGLSFFDAAALAATPSHLAGLELSLVMSHLACADQPGHAMNDEQAARFAQGCALFPGVPRSLASSGGLFQQSDYTLDMVRPGISLYGGGPFGRPDTRLQPVAWLHAPVLQVREVSPGETVGYGAAFRAERPMRIAVVAAGYADGVLRGASPKGYEQGGYGWLDGTACPFLGRISMDLIALDVTDHDAARPDPCQPGDRIELLGANVAVDDLARSAGTIALEVLTRIGARGRRVYLGAAG